MAKPRLLTISSIVGLILGLIGLIIVATLYAITKESHTMFAVVLDAGSSSTKMNLFQFRDEAFRTNAELQLIVHQKVVGGISDYINQPFEAYKHMSSKLQRLISEIPTKERSRTPVYLGATAGMRLELLKDPLASLRLFEILRRNLLSSGLFVETPNERIRLLSGAEEGLYGWVSVNSILDLISADKQVEASKTIGSLDLGGASTQISFASDVVPTKQSASVDFYPLKLFGKNYRVYSHSYLCFGKNEFERRLKAALIGTQKSSEIKHPCFLAGYKLVNQSVDDIFGSPCVTGAYADKSFTTDLTKPEGLDRVTFVGTGDAAQCKAVIKSQFQSLLCEASPCTFNGVYQPEVQGEFRAYSGYSFLMAYLFPQKAKGFTINEVTDAVKGFCARPWTEVQKEPKSEYATKYCFDGYYILTLLSHLGFNTDDKFGKITFGDKINGSTVSWAMGYMLDQSGHLPSEIPKIHMPLALFATLAAIFVVLIVLSLIGLIVGLNRRGDKEIP